MGHYRRQSAHAAWSAAWIYAPSGDALPPPARRSGFPARLTCISSTEDRVLALLFFLGTAKPVHPAGARRGGKTAASARVADPGKRRPTGPPRDVAGGADEQGARRGF